MTLLSRVCTIMRQQTQVLMKKEVFASRVAASHFKKTNHAHFFHSSSRNMAPPVFLVVITVLKKVGQVAAVLTGRTLRRRWVALPEATKHHYLGRLYSRRTGLFTASAVTGIIISCNYVMHLQTTPITGRSRYISLTPRQFDELADFEFETHWEEWKSKVIPPNHPVYSAVAKVMKNLVRANQDLQFFREKKWTVIIVDDPIENAFVLPNGKIFLFSGILQAMQNEDHLAFILSHEISHALLNHGAEKLSFAQVLDLIWIFMIGAIWFLMPTDGLAVVALSLYKLAVGAGLELPYSREMEAEADHVGLTLMAKACYDVRESSAFWLMMEVRARSRDECPPPEFMSTHPGNESRVRDLDERMIQALSTRECQGCPHLRKADPRPEMAQLLDEMKVLEKRQQQEKELNALHTQHMRTLRRGPGRLRADALLELTHPPGEVARDSESVDPAVALRGPHIQNHESQPDADVPKCNSVDSQLACQTPVTIPDSPGIVGLNTSPITFYSNTQQALETVVQRFEAAGSPLASTIDGECSG